MVTIHYNFYRFRGGLAPLSNPPQTQTESLQNSILPIFDFSEPVSLYNGHFYCNIINKCAMFLCKTVDLH